MKKLFIFSAIMFILTGCSNKEYTISFVTNSDQIIESIMIRDYKQIIQPEVLDKEGYELEGWYTNETLTEIYDFSNTIYQDTTLYIKWIPIEYTVNYIILNFDMDPITELIVYNDNGTFPTPTLEGHTFKGWYVNSDMITLVSAYAITNEATFYGTFTLDEPGLEVDIALIVDPYGVNDSCVYQNTFDGIQLFSTENSKISKYYNPISLDIDDLIMVSELAISEGADVIVLPGFLYENIAFYLQTHYPEITIILLDGSPHNVVNYDPMVTIDGEEPEFLIGNNTSASYFKEQDLGFIAGYIAVSDGYTNLGYIGGMAVPAIVRYGIGYVAGAFYAANELDIDITFNDGTYLYEPVFWETQILQAKAAFMYSIGVEVIFTTTMGGSKSVARAASLEDGKMIHAEFDNLKTFDSILTTVIKGYDRLVYNLLSNYYNDELVTGTSRIVGLEEDVIYINFSNSNFNTFSETEYSNIINQIKDGTIVIPATYDELVIFLGEDSVDFERDTIQPN